MVAGNRIKNVRSKTLSRFWAKLEKVSFDYCRSDGQWETQTREIYDRGHGAAILLYDLSRSTVILIRQFRFPVYRETGDGFLLEVPAGILEGDDPVATIIAETEQETGFRIGRVQKIFTAFASPGSMTERLHYFVSDYSVEDKCGRGGGLVNEGEDIEVLEVTFNQAMEWLQTGRIQDAKTILLLQYAALHIFPPNVHEPEKPL